MTIIMMNDQFEGLPKVEKELNSNKLPTDICHNVRHMSRSQCHSDKDSTTRISDCSSAAAHNIYDDSELFKHGYFHLAGD